MKRLSVVQDSNKQVASGINAPDYIDARVLAANVAKVHTIPTNAVFVLFSSTSDFYVNYDAAAAVPATDVTSGAGSELNPTLRKIDGLSTIGLIAPATCVVTLCFFADNPWL
jgi:hypothetical protein